MTAHCPSRIIKAGPNKDSLTLHHQTKQNWVYNLKTLCWTFGIFEETSKMDKLFFTGTTWKEMIMMMTMMTMMMMMMMTTSKDLFNVLFFSSVEFFFFTHYSSRIDLNKLMEWWCS